MALLRMCYFGQHILRIVHSFISVLCRAEFVVDNAPQNVSSFHFVKMLSVSCSLCSSAHGKVRNTHKYWLKGLKGRDLDVHLWSILEWILENQNPTCYQERKVCEHTRKI